MLTSNYLTHLTDDIGDIYEELQSTIINDIVRRILRMGEISESSMYQTEILQESGMLYEDVLKNIARMIGSSDSALQEAFKNAGVQTLQFDDSVYKKAGLNPLPIKQSPAMLQILEGGLRKTKGHLHNLTLTTAATSQKAFIKASNLAYNQVVTGGMDYISAIKQAVHKLSRDGITTVSFETGHVDQLDVAIRRAVLTGANQTSGNIQMERIDEMGWGLVETSAHMGARPSHVHWQGQIFSIKGRNDHYPDFISSTGYGSGDGLMGWNCKHSFYPFFEGYSTPAYTSSQLLEFENQTVIVNGKEISFYDATQKQRAQERTIRLYKRELSAIDIARKQSRDSAFKSEFDKDFAKLSVQLKNRENRLNDFVRQAGLSRQREREQTYGFDRSLAQKASWANKKAN